MQQKHDQGVERHQFDDYIFESCHYLETSHFTANYRNTMVESNSHEFRPSTTALTSASYSSHSSVHAFDLYEIKPAASIVCKTTPLSQQQSLNSINSQAQYHYHHHHHPYVTVHAQQPPVLGPPARRFQLQARLTSSGVQTEITPSSLSTAATSASLASRSNSCSNSYSSKNSHATSAKSSEVVFCRLMPILKCCYTPIDRWCERRNAASQDTTQKQRTANPAITAVTMEKRKMT